MVTIDLERVNVVAPYHFTPTSYSVLTFSILTDYGVKYTMSFYENDLLPGIHAYEFVISNVNQRKSPRDIKLRQSIIALIQEFFRQREAVLIYLCETGDNRQRQRFRLFESWFRISGKGNFVSLSMDLVDLEGVPNYAAIITRMDNPNLSFITKQFTETVELLREKPE